MTLKTGLMMLKIQSALITEINSKQKTVILKGNIILNIFDQINVALASRRDNDKNILLTPNFCTVYSVCVKFWR